MEVLDYSTISKFMKNNVMFFMGNLELKPNKVPCRINTARADTTNTEQYVDLDTAVVLTYKQRSFDGISIGCSKPMKLADIDDCAQGGSFGARGRAIDNTLDFYTEFRPSGNGLHIFILLKSSSMIATNISSIITKHMLKSMTLMQLARL